MCQGLIQQHQQKPEALDCITHPLRSFKNNFGEWEKSLVAAWPLEDSAGTAMLACCRYYFHSCGQASKKGNGLHGLLHFHLPPPPLGLKILKLIVGKIPDKPSKIQQWWSTSYTLVDKFLLAKILWGWKRVMYAKLTLVHSSMEQMLDHFSTKLHLCKL